MYRLKHHKYITILTLAVFILAFGIVFIPQAAQAEMDPGEPSDRGIQPEVVWAANTNPCSDETHTWYKVDSPSSGNAGPVYYQVYAQQFLQWQNNSEDMYVHAIYVKGGGSNIKPQSNTHPNNVYYYTSAIQSDSTLHTSINPNNQKYYDISHIIFCLLSIPQVDPAANPELKITKEVKLTSEADETYGASCSATTGQQVTYRIIAANIGDVELSNIAIVDEMLGINEKLETLAPGDAHIITKEHSFTTADTYKNTATVTGYYEEELSANDSADVIVSTGGGDSVPTINPELGITKEVKLTSEADEAYGASCTATTGQQVTYRIIVTNTGDVELSNIEIVDEMLEVEELLETLASGASYTIITEHIFTAAKTYENIASVTAYYEEEKLNDNASATVTVTSKDSGGENDDKDDDKDDVNDNDKDKDKDNDKEGETDDKSGGGSDRDRPTSGNKSDKEIIIDPEAPSLTVQEPPIVEELPETPPGLDEAVPELPKTGTNSILFSSMGLVLVGGGLVLNRLSRKRHD